MNETAAGWYDDPTSVFEQRYWSGSGWTDQVTSSGVRGVSRPDADPVESRALAASMASPVPTVDSAQASTGPAHPPPSSTPQGPKTVGLRPPYQDPLTQPSPRDSDGDGPADTGPNGSEVDNRFLWGIIAAPVIAGTIEMISGHNPGLSWLLTGGVVAANVALSYADHKAHPRLAERHTTGGLLAAAALLMPVYVFLRQRALGQSRLWFAGYAAAFLGIIALQFVTGTVNQIDGPYLESEIEDWASSTIGATNVTVECPSNEPAQPGHRFVCELNELGETYGVRVEVLNRNGDVEWEL